MHPVARVLLGLVLVSAAALNAQDEVTSYRTWSRERAQTIARSTRVDGRVGGAWDLRVLRTERAYNYKLRTTLMSPEVVRATARLAQLTEGLSDEETATLVADAEKAGDLVVMFEIDPREGSGIVPPDMVVLLRPKVAQDSPDGAIRAVLTPALRNARALAGAYRRDYAYEQFWAVFAVDDDHLRRMLRPPVTDIELVVRIYDKEGRVSWKIPESLRAAQVQSSARRLAGHAADDENHPPLRIACLMIACIRP